ncbi:MAG: prepilin-type N-terminal cleavage/methylation domain-containing protein [Desulfobacteraceae bacterium]|nr:prepilin-type N-terminal cleavage/methylation domain-containing protein [Desulfobacteraceae bacterium]
MIHILKNKKGFTLVEIIVTMILVSILSAGAGMGIVAITQGYLYAGKNGQMAQKTNIAMKRMSRELQDIYFVSAASASSITFFSTLGQRTIGFDTNAIKLSENGDPIAGGDILIDDIANFTFSFTHTSGGSWSVGNDIQDLTGITISFDVLRSDIASGSMTFTTTVYLRSNNNLGGTI